MFSNPDNNAMVRKWNDAENDISDEQIEHREPNEEMQFLHWVASGDIDSVVKNCKEGHFSNMEEGVGVLSRNPVTNLKYHFIVTIALVTRYCNEAGMEKECAYRLSDFYITKLDDINTEKGVIELHDHAVIDFTKKMRFLKQNFSTSKPVNEALEYIYAHIKDRLSINEVAESLSISPGYLSRLFKKEVGISFSDYIREEKMKRARHLLRNSEYSIIDIVDYLGYSSQSHFTQVFKNETGLTPKLYRDKYFRTAWV